MGKTLVVFLSFLIVVVCGNESNESDLSAAQNSNRGESENQATLKIQNRLTELENFHNEFKEMKPSLLELVAAFARFQQFLVANGTAGETKETQQSDLGSTKNLDPVQDSGEDGKSPAPHIHTDKTLEAGANGADVVKAVIDKIHGSGIFPDDHSFLHRLAFAESRFGQDPRTFRSSFYGGIWQISQDNYEKTKARGGQLGKYHDQIHKTFNINWRRTNWNDLLKPLYSGLAARLLLSSFSQPIPQVLTRQANFRRERNLKSPIGLSTKEFKKQIKLLEANQTCTGTMDLLVVLDESGSVGDLDFQKSLEFVGNLFKSYSNAPRGNVRMGFMTYSNSFRYHFHIVNSLSLNEIFQTVNSTSYEKGGTNTNRAIQRGIDQFTNGNNGYKEREGVPKIIALFTDGHSQDGVSNSDKAGRFGITNFAVGIGPHQNETELKQIANNDESRVFSLEDFDALIEFFGRLSSATCAVSQKPKTETNVIDELGQDEKRIYCYVLPPDGITISLTSSLGNVTGYFSYSYETPSAALNDGVLSQLKTFIPPQTSTEAGDSISPLFFKEERNCDVYVTIQGVGGPRNNYAVTVVNGNTMHNNNGK